MALHRSIFTFLLAACLTQGLLAQDDVCSPNPCPDGKYCFPEADGGVNPYQCIVNGYRPGHCSLNAFMSCDEYAKCEDAPDHQSYICICQEGAEGDGYKTEVEGTGCKLGFKPCSSDSDCPEYGVCNKDEYKCFCKNGFEGDGTECRDIDECKDSPCDKNAKCQNFPGAFKCTCNDNYLGDGFKCVLFCYNDNDCDAPRARCNETNLCECLDGYEGDGMECKDIDECEAGTHDCHGSAMCKNTEGSFECVCGNGFSGDGKICEKLPQSCIDIENFNSGQKYLIDPDFTGPANAFKVVCAHINDVVVTKLLPTGNYPLGAPEDKSPLDITYEPTPDDIKPLLQNSQFCYQDVSYVCPKNFALFPGLKWFDSFGNGHENWGSTKHQKCACGEVKSCPSNCYCDGTQTRSQTDCGRIVDKGQLPIVRLEFNHDARDKGSVTIEPLICAEGLVDVPKDCHQAKFEFNKKKDTPLHIDIDGPGGQPPFLVFCDMESFKHVGITQIPPEEDVIVPTQADGSPVDYVSELPKLTALIEGSVFCSQHVEFVCKKSKLLGGSGYVSVAGNGRRLDYFPGGNGAGACGCGATKSCDAPEVKCNCDIGDEQERKDFGLIINKADLPVVKVTAEIGGDKSGTYTLGPLRCSQKQFGIEPNCEKYRGTGVTESYTYFIDPDGPGNLDPFPVECEFIPSPPQGSTIVHHDNEGSVDIATAAWLIHYLQASAAQINALKERSTFCTQDIKIECNQFNIQLSGGTIGWDGAGNATQKLPDYLETCGEDGSKCHCSSLSKSSDNGVIADLEQLPVNKMLFDDLISQLSSGGSLTISLGPLVCSEVFPTCAVLKSFIKSGAAVEGEAEVVNGFFTIDPDGPGGTEPFEVECRFPQTIIIVGPSTETIKPNTGDPNGPVSKCYDITYTNANGATISSAQITALVRKSGTCRQDLSLDCKHAPATNMVNFTSCDGVKQKGWAGSFGEDSCACGVNGNCAGGPDALCNCDMTDGVQRSDSATIVSTDRLPVCQVCLGINPIVPEDGSAGPESFLRYRLGQLKCDGGRGIRSNCQEARRIAGTYVTEVTETAVTVQKNNPVPVGCIFYPDPPVGVLTVKPKVSVVTPDDGSTTTDIQIIYITMDISVIKVNLDKSEYCTQKLYLFCATDQTVALGGNYGWFNYKGEISQDWSELPADGSDVNQVCEDLPDLCSKCGLPKGFVLTDKAELPMTRLLLATGGVSIVIGDVECLDIKKSCQEILDTRSWQTGLVKGSKYVIDPDSAGPVDPFVVNCEFDQSNGNGVSEVPVSGEWVGSVQVVDKTAPGDFSLPVEYPGVDPKQIDALTKISDFCWQGVKYECAYSPLVSKTDPPSSYYSFFEGGPSPSFGTDSDTNFPGCACATTGTCMTGFSCNCDAMGRMAVDQGAVTNKDVLPIVSVTVGGQIADLSTANVQVTNIRCSSKPIDPPRDCAAAKELGSKFGITYSYSSEYLISPDPANVEPFMVRCDFDMSPGNGVTVIKPNYPEQKPVQKKPGEFEEIPYYGPSDEQIAAVVKQSAFCYQGVKFECFGTELFKGGSYWLPAGSREKRFFWGGGEPTDEGAGGVCACGKDQSCGGLDSAIGQRTRGCNCDYGDNTFRSDAGIFDVKSALPISQFWWGNRARFNQANMTVGDLYCSQEPLKFNECELGFYDCHPLAACVDEDDGYRCVCPDGYNGRGVVLHSSHARANGRECIDDNECVANKPCPYSATCHNIPGDFTCKCKDGYTQTGKTSCQDIDECADDSLNDCDSNARCENLDGSFRCLCNRGFRGDGRTCIPVGECTCFGDPHCTSFDNRWLHFMGLCSYVMSQDGCDGSPRSYRVIVEHWNKDAINPGYFSWIKSVTIEIFGKSIKLDQGSKIYVDGILVRQYYDQHRLSVVFVNQRVKLRAITGLEITWNGEDIVTVTVPKNATDKVCGLCGDYDGNPNDDWTQGPACPEFNGVVTDNFEKFGRSWLYVSNDTKQCDVDCGKEPNQPVTPEENCNFPVTIVEQECNKLLDPATSPFRDCLRLKTAQVIEEWRIACLYDLCNAADMDGQICYFADTISTDCADNDRVPPLNWKDKVDACEKPSCKNNMIYKECGPASQPSCLDGELVESIDVTVCVPGCFCASGLVMEGERCISPSECGCTYDGGYMEIGDTVFLPDCSEMITCNNFNQTSSQPVNCGANQECRLQEGVVDCYCTDGYVMKDGECKVDNCFKVECNIPNMECDNGTCVCKMGYIGDCNQCEDLNECETGEDNCNKIGQKCVNTPGSFQCLCQDGFVANGDSCKDINECEYGIDTCGENSECVNTLGGFLCECCAGYKKDGQNNCVRDTEQTTASGGRCCACSGRKCPEPGKVCGTDGKTYSTYRSLAVSACKNNKDDLKVAYKGPCKGTCSAVVCDKQYSDCKMVEGKPQCVCPSCEDSTSEYEEITVCATNKITYTSICNMKQASCEAEYETTVDVEFTGKPCPGDGSPIAGPWSDWGDCSEPCKQGVRVRTREVFVNSSDVKFHTREEIPCYNTCPDGPCTAETCTGPGQVCSVDAANNPSCSCPICDEIPKEPVCGRLGIVIQTYDNQCALDKEACEQNNADYETLEPRACEDKPKDCGLIRNYQVPKDDNNCEADRSINLGECYGGCDEEAELCCHGDKTEEKVVKMECPDGSSYTKPFEVIVGCNCITKETVDALKMNIVR